MTPEQLQEMREDTAEILARFDRLIEHIDAMIENEQIVFPV